MGWPSDRNCNHNLLEEYDHLNSDPALTISIDMADLVARVRGLNRGTQRFLAELVRQRRDAAQRAYDERQATGTLYAADSPLDDLAEGIAALFAPPHPRHY